MDKLNKGEWSELYAIMTLLLNPKLLVVDSNLDKIPDKLYDFVQELASLVWYN